mmetsp:Transcript_40078/g.159404  ORF Transcript_40078/g.159404 Transcript_40078/m.159404 type:complete len:135 (-) Transcript_40078:73-477(-)
MGSIDVRNVVLKAPVRPAKSPTNGMNSTGCQTKMKPEPFETKIMMIVNVVASVYQQPRQALVSRIWEFLVRLTSPSTKRLQKLRRRLVRRFKGLGHWKLHHNSIRCGDPPSHTPRRAGGSSSALVPKKREKGIG